ncbi:HD domain-containing phosphohydrolase [Rhodoferax sp.]|uniref:HD domain-containing phosphohydrolase n=1 Tax=Rhodoferax sp. TaxID=50421 RepID=UPI0026383C08|nr:HD domain-containing phosphohydrolase [Rhodoferax sp.]
MDDDPKLRKTLCDILRLKGFEAGAAETGALGIAEAGNTFFNVALLDLKLPDMSGIEVMERIKHATPLTEAIILTGHASLDTAVEATNKGAFSYLLKPYAMDDLLLHIRHAIDRQQAQQEILRLASFPTMDPNPVMEVDAARVITYLNPAAKQLFPRLAVGQPAPAELGYLPAASGEDRQMVREVNVDNATFEQFLYPVPHSEMVRIHLLDITERKVDEARLRRLNLLLLTIRNINEYLLVAESEAALYHFVCEALKGLEDVIGVIISLRQPDHTLNHVAWAGFSETMMADLVVRWDGSEFGGGVMGVAAREAVPNVVTDIEHDTRYLPWREIVQTWQLKSAAAVPLASDGETMGVLAAYSGRRDAFSEEIINFLLEVANDIALGVHALRLDKRLHATLASLRKSLDGTVEAVARMVELRDPYTAGHQRRVAQLACAIGKEMGLPERQVEGLRVIGYLHDIGKIALPAEILSKPSTLSALEIAMIRGHSGAGYDILKDIEFPWPVAQAVWQHHERLDGSGYPQGLKSPDILLEARILMVADTVEAMASHRPYRAARGLDAAFHEISTNKGKLYEPTAVDACLRLFTEHGFSWGEK